MVPEWSTIGNRRKRVTISPHRPMQLPNGESIGVISSDLDPELLGFSVARVGENRTVCGGASLG
jgi:hypothetical protein